VRCAANDRAAVTLKVSKRLAKALKKARGSVTATVRITLGAGTTATSDSKRLVLSAAKRKQG
jgi:hypothetical protein